MFCCSAVRLGRSSKSTLSERGRYPRAFCTWRSPATAGCKMFVKIENRCAGLVSKTRKCGNEKLYASFVKTGCMRRFLAKTPYNGCAEHVSKSSEIGQLLCRPRQPHGQKHGAYGAYRSYGAYGSRRKAGTNNVSGKSFIRACSRRVD